MYTAHRGDFCTQTCVGRKTPLNKRTSRELPRQKVARMQFSSQTRPSQPTTQPRRPPRRQWHRLGAVVASAIASGAIILSLGVTPDAQAHDKNGQDNTPEQCVEAHDAVANGKPLPQLELFRKGHGAVHDGKVVIFNDSKRYSDEIQAAADSWTQATGGEIAFDVVDKKTTNSVRVFDVHRDDAKWVGWTRHEPYRVLLNAAYLDGMSQSARQGTMAHEFGHLLGLKHSCPGDLMHAISDQQQPQVPQQTDVQAALQGDNDKTVIGTTRSFPDYLA